MQSYASTSDVSRAPGPFLTWAKMAGYCDFSHHLMINSSLKWMNYYQFKQLHCHFSHLSQVLTQRDAHRLPILGILIRFIVRLQYLCVNNALEGDLIKVNLLLSLPRFHLFPSLLAIACHSMCCFLYSNSWISSSVIFILPLPSVLFDLALLYALPL